MPKQYTGKLFGPPPPGEVEWSVAHSDGTVRVVMAQTAAQALQRVGWTFSDVKHVRRVSETMS